MVARCLVHLADEGVDVGLAVTVVTGIAGQPWVQGFAEAARLHLGAALDDLGPR